MGHNPSIPQASTTRQSLSFGTRHTSPPCGQTLPPQRSSNLHSYLLVLWVLSLMSINTYMPLPSLRISACLTYGSISQESALALIDKNGRAYKMLSSLPWSQWRVISFDNYNKVICIQLLAKSGSRLISVSCDP